MWACTKHAHVHMH